MTKQQHYALYQHLHEAINKKIGESALTQCQKRFVEAFEAGCFGTDFLRCYAELVDSYPDVSLEELHSFCIGHGIGIKQYVPEVIDNLSFH